MTDVTNKSEIPHPAAPLRRRTLAARLVAIGVVLLLFAAAFAQASGWLGSRGVSAGGMVDALQANAGAHPGFRRNHAKGICVAGYFEGNGKASHLSAADFLAERRASVNGRFAIAGGNPLVADDSVPVRSLALQLRLADGQEWRTGMNDIPSFPVSTPQAFFEQTLAMRPDPATGKPDPAALQAFQAAHPEAVAFGQRLKASPRASSLVNDTYNGINAFVFVAADGSRQLVRWAMEPQAPFAIHDPAVQGGRDRLFNDLLAQLDQGPLRWHLIVTLAAAGDAGDDAAQPWPPQRERIDAGTLTLTAASSEETGGCRDIVYDPLVLPRGIEPSADPLLSARSATYAVSYRRRAGEPPGESALHDRSTGVAP